VEMTEHLGYEKNSSAGDNTGNSRNGHFEKTVLLENQSAAISCHPHGWRLLLYYIISHLLYNFAIFCIFYKLTIIFVYDILIKKIKISFEKKGDILNG
jgi:hypothetical protein